MMIPLTALVLASAVTAPLESGLQHSFRGTMIADKGDPAETKKSFELSLLVEAADASGAMVHWTLTEDGRGGWDWPSRFGTLRLDGELRGDTNTGPSLLYDREEGLSIVPLLAPFFAPGKTLAKGAAWSEARVEFQVIGAAKKAGRDTWVVEVRTPIGRKRTLWVDQASPVVVAMEEVVFIGQGEQHELEMELVESQRLNPAQRERTIAAFEAFARLRETLNHEPRELGTEWSADQLAVLKAALPMPASQAESTILQAVADEATADSKDQKNRSNAIAALRKNALNKPVPDFKLPGTAGEEVNSKDFKGNITVLHFWEYRDTPLQEPYGQVGYLDFLGRQRSGQGLAIYGVVVDERLANADTRQRAITSAKKLKSFMNLSYPILLDDGSLIKSIGDPRVTGAKLPLYVVVDSQGKVIHYHAGLYEVDRERGLKELDEVVKQALDNRE